jgi:hypothetical protein
MLEHRARLARAQLAIERVASDDQKRRDQRASGLWAIEQQLCSRHCCLARDYADGKKELYKRYGVVATDVALPCRLRRGADRLDVSRGESVELRSEAAAEFRDGLRRETVQHLVGRVSCLKRLRG